MIVSSSEECISRTVIQGRKERILMFGQFIIGKKIAKIILVIIVILQIGGCCKHETPDVPPYLVLSGVYYYPSPADTDENGNKVNSQVLSDLPENYSYAGMITNGMSAEDELAGCPYYMSKSSSAIYVYKDVTEGSKTVKRYVRWVASIP